MALDDADALVGQQCEQFRLVERLDSAAADNVFRAFDTAAQETVALTLYPTALPASTSLLARVRNEVRRINALKHPHLLPVAYVGAAHERLFGVTRIPHESLASRLRGSGALTPDVGARLIGDIAWAVYALHSIGLVHGAITPAAVWLDENGVPHLLDLGIGRALGEQQRGEPRGGVRRLLRKVQQLPPLSPYAAPERQRNGILNVGTDIYALGAVLREIVDGHAPPPHPYVAGSADGNAQRENSAEVWWAPLDSTLADSAALQTILQTALAADPAQRFADARALAVALHAAATPAVAPVVTPSLPETLAGVRHVRTAPLRTLQPGDLLAHDSDLPVTSDARKVAAAAPVEVAYTDDVALISAHEAASATTASGVDTAPDTRAAPTPPSAPAAASDTPASAASPIQS